MKHIFLYCPFFCCLSPAILHGQKATKGTQNPHLQQQDLPSEAYEQVIRIKFKPEQTSRLDAMLANKANRQGVLDSRTGQPLQTGIQAIDRKNEAHRVNSMRRVFRPAGKYEDRHRAWGLHLWYEIRFTSNTPVAELMSAYAQVEGVEVTEPVFKYNLRDVENHEPLPYVWQADTSDSQNNPQSVPNDGLYAEPWGFTRINAPQAWDVETGDPRVVVAIEDQGVDYTHPDLDGRMWTNPSETPGNNIDDDNNGYVDDYYGYNFGDNRGEIAIGYHGTHVGGTVAAETNNETGVAGTAGGWGDDQGVRLMSLSVFGANSQGGFDEAFIYAADMGAVISQNSWGGGSQSNALEDAIDYFIANAGGTGKAMEGGLVVFAAGNDNSSSNSMGYPGSYEPVIAVASITSENKKSSFSNYGNWVDISAPGSSILSTYPVNQGSYNSISGTSMACPHVTGVATLVVSYNYGAITNAELRERLEGTTSDIYTDNPSYEGMLGTGVVDAYAALTGEVAPPPPPAYCASRGGSVVDEWIESVTIGDFTHNSGSNGGYANFTQSHTVELTAGSTYDLSLSPGFSGSTYNEYWKIWIDLNGDKDFNDEGELVFDAGSLSSATVNGSLSIAASQDTITTRMRISMKYSGAPTSCEFFDFGEVEDYTARIIHGDTPPPGCGTPEGLAAVNVTETTAFLSWNPVEGADSYDIRYRSAADTVWAYLVSEGDSVELSNLQEGTSYEAQVASVCGEATSAYSETVVFTTEEGTEPPAVEYCEAAGNNSSYFWIDLVRVGSMNNPNGTDGGYGDYTALTPGNLVKGASNSLVVSAGYSYWQFTLHWRIWIDYNQDGVFHTSEIFVSGTSNSAGELTATNTIPSSALSGNTRMRVAMRYMNYADPCGTFSYGEVEDYTVNISNNAAATFISRTTEANSLTDGMESALRTYPNPVREQLKLSTEIPAGIKMNILDARGATVKTIISQENENELDVQDLEPGIYHLSIPTPLEAIHVQFLKL